MLDAALTKAGDQSGITADLLDQILRRVKPSLAAAAGATVPPLMVVFLDPVSLDLVDPAGSRIGYDLGSGTLTSQRGDAFVSVAGNVEVIVMPICVPSHPMRLAVYFAALTRTSTAPWGGTVA